MRFGFYVGGQGLNWESSKNGQGAGHRRPGPGLGLPIGHRGPGAPRAGPKVQNGKGLQMGKGLAVGGPGPGVDFFGPARGGGGTPLSPQPVGSVQLLIQPCFYKVFTFSEMVPEI